MKYGRFLVVFYKGCVFYKGRKGEHGQKGIHQDWTFCGGRRVLCGRGDCVGK